MKKTVLILVNHEVVIYNFRKELVIKLLEEGYNVIVSSPYGSKIKELIAMGCTHSDLQVDRHSKNPFSDLKLLSHYTKIIKKHQPDIVLTYTIKPNIYGSIASRKFGIPYIANITGLGTAVEYPGILQIITVNLYKIAFRKKGVVFFQNEENRSFFRDRNIAVDKHSLLPGSGVNVQEFSLLPYPNEENINFVFISRIMKEKGIQQYIDAAKFIKKKYPFTRFHICGFHDGNYEEIISELSLEGTVIYHGMVDNIREVLNFSHCTVHPTYYPEGMSNVLLESSASGRPIITTDRSGCKEVVNNGKNGYIVKQKDSQDLIDKIEQFLALSHSEKEKMGFEGRKFIEQNFNRDIVVDKYMDAINENLRIIL